MIEKRIDEFINNQKGLNSGCIYANMGINYEDRHFFSLTIPSGWECEDEIEVYEDADKEDLQEFLDLVENQFDILKGYWEEMIRTLKEIIGS